MIDNSDFDYDDQDVNNHDDDDDNDDNNDVDDDVNCKSNPTSHSLLPASLSSSLPNSLPPSVLVLTCRYTFVIIICQLEGRETVCVVRVGVEVLLCIKVSTQRFKLD